MAFNVPCGQKSRQYHFRAFELVIYCDLIASKNVQNIKTCFTEVSGVVRSFILFSELRLKGLE